MKQLSPEMESLKARLRASWIAGDFGVIARSYQHESDAFVARLGPSGKKILDVACGSGNLAIPAAAAGADVTGLDIAPNLVEQARARANEAGLTASFDVGDAEDTPYEDGSFDVVMTMFGAMFAPRPEVVAAEMRRVLKPGGTLAMANWTPEGFTGQMFKIGAKHVPPPPAMPSPVLWGKEEVAAERLASGWHDLRTTRRKLKFHFPFSPSEVVESFVRFFGPTVKAYESLDETGRSNLRRDLEDLWTGANTATDGSTEVESEYLEVLATKI